MPQNKTKKYSRSGTTAMEHMLRNKTKASVQVMGQRTVTSMEQIRHQQYVLREEKLSSRRRSFKAADFMALEVLQHTSSFVTTSRHSKINIKLLKITTYTTKRTGVVFILYNHNQISLKMQQIIKFKQLFKAAQKRVLGHEKQIVSHDENKESSRTLRYIHYEGIQRVVSYNRNYNVGIIGRSDTVGLQPVNRQE